MTTPTLDSSTPSAQPMPLRSGSQSIPLPNDVALFDKLDENSYVQWCLQVTIHVHALLKYYGLAGVVHVKVVSNPRISHNYVMAEDPLQLLSKHARFFVDSWGGRGKELTSWFISRNQLLAFFLSCRFCYRICDMMRPCRRS